MDSLGWRALLLARLLRPVVTIVADRGNDFSARDDGQRVLKVFLEPVLAGNGAGCPTGIVLVIVHEDDAVGKLSNGAVVEFLIVHWNRNIELEPLGLQVAVPVS